LTPDTPAHGGRRSARLALIVTLAIQAFTALAATATAVLAGEIAASHGLSPTLIGVFVGILYAAAMLASLASGGFIERYGPIRVSQVCTLLCAIGLALVAAPRWALPLAPVLIGIGYGPITPASSHLLARTTRPDRLALTFSIKQTGVPLGAALAGALLPSLALGFGWHAAMIAVATFGVVIALAAQPTRASLDAERGGAAGFSLDQLLMPLKTVLASKVLIELTATGFVYASTQVCLLSFLVVFLNAELGEPLVAAGFALTVATVGGVVGRVLWGLLADRRIAPRRLLALLGVVAGACALACAALGPAWPRPLALAIIALFGMTAIGWNGVQLSEVARHAPRGLAGAVTGAGGFITFAGVVVGPPLFALLATLSGRYALGFAVAGVASIGCGAWLARRTR
jgi:MFS family permease